MTKLIISTLMFFIITSFILNTLNSHPLMMASTIIFQSTLMSMIIIMTTGLSWLMYMLILIFLGGILMLFLYIISMIEIKTPLIKKTSILAITGSLLFVPKQMKIDMEWSTNKFMKFISSSFSSSSMHMSIYFMLLLLLIMLMVVFITEMNKGNMRKM